MDTFFYSTSVPVSSMLGEIYTGGLPVSSTDLKGFLPLVDSLHEVA